VNTRLVLRSNILNPSNISAVGVLARSFSCVDNCLSGASVETLSKRERERKEGRMGVKGRHGGGRRTLFMFVRRWANSSRISCSRGERVGECEVGGGAGGVEAMLGEEWLACGVSRFLLMRYEGNVCCGGVDSCP